MSKIACEVIRDLLPICIDDIASEETKKLVENHIQECDECKKELNMLRKNIEEDKKISDSLEDAKIIRSFRKTIQRKQLTMVLISVIAAVVVSLSGMKIYIDSTRPELNGNEMIASTSVAVNGVPEEVFQNVSNGVEISKELGKAYISIPVNNKKIKSCHVRLLLDEKVIDDRVISVSDARYVTYCLDYLEKLESGFYMLEYYDSNDEINQYKWFNLK